MDAAETIKIAKWVIDNREITPEEKANMIHRVGMYYTDSRIVGEGEATCIDGEFKDGMIPWLRKQVTGHHNSSYNASKA